MRFTLPAINPKRPLHILAVGGAAALLLFILLTSADNASAQQPIAGTATPTSAPSEIAAPAQSARILAPG